MPERVFRWNRGLSSVPSSMIPSTTRPDYPPSSQVRHVAPELSSEVPTNLTDNETRKIGPLRGRLIRLGTRNTPTSTE